MPSTLLNFILFQIGWFACVLGAANDMALTGSVIALAIIAFNVLVSNHKRAELLLVMSAMLIGLVWDSALVYMGWINYTTGQFQHNLAPYWIIIMWGLFATTLNSSLSWLKDKLVFAVLFGLLGGPLAYYAGENLGALSLNQFNNALIALAIGWGVFTPLLLKISSALNHHEQKVIGSLL